MKQKRRKYLLLAVLLAVIAGYISYGPDKLDVSAADVVQMEISDDLTFSMVITNQEDIDRIISSFNSCHKKMIEPRLIGSSVPPYFIRFHFHDGSTEELRFIPKELDSSQRTAIMDPLGSFGFMEGDLYYVFWEVASENTADPEVYEWCIHQLNG